MKNIAIVRTYLDGFWVEISDRYGQTRGGAMLKSEADIRTFVERMEAEIVSDARMREVDHDLR